MTRKQQIPMPADILVGETITQYRARVHADSNDEKAKAECERLFQAGGPKVYFQNEPGGPLRASSFSARRSVDIRDSGQAVYARQKNRMTGRYEWRCVGLGATPVPAAPVKAGPLAKTVGPSKGLTFTAADMGRALFQSDAWPPRPGAKLNSCADICSYLTRVLLGRNLMLGRGPIRVNLENGHHLIVTMQKNEV